MTRVVLALAAALTLLRFVDLASAPFINDEPAFQLLIDDHLAAGTLPTHALRGNKGIVYGPTALWIYTPVRWLTDSVVAITAYHALLQAIGFLLLFFAVRRSLGLSVAAWTWLLCAASPYLFFYARLPWDNTFLVPLTGLLLLLLTRLDERAERIGSWIALGAVFGLLFGLHLMSLPMIGAAGLALLPRLWRSRRSLRTWGGAGLGVVVMVVILIPYLRVVAGSLSAGSQLAVTTEGLRHALPETLLGTGLFHSTEGMDYFFEPVTDVINGRLGPLALSRWLAWVVRVVAWLWIARTLVRLRALVRQPVVVRYGVAFVVLLLGYYYLVRPYPLHPHYFMAAFWVVPCFASLVVASIPRPAAIALHACLGLLVLGNVAFVLSAHAQIRRDHGTRAYHYSSTPGETRRATAAVCDEARRRAVDRMTVDLSQVPGVLPMPFRWWARHLPACRGIELGFDGAAQARITYGRGSSTDARLVVELP